MNEFIRLVREVLSLDGHLPCTVIVLDEIQLFIGNDPGRSTDVQEVAEAERMRLVAQNAELRAKVDELSMRIAEGERGWRMRSAADSACFAI